MKKVKLTILSILLVFVTVFTLVGCDRLFDESTEPTPPGASQVNITRETAEVGVGKAIQLVAQKQNNTDPTVWFSSDDRIATVSATGRVEGKYPGVVTITAMAGSASDTCTVTVTGEVPEGSVEYNKQVTGNGAITVAGGYELGDTATVTFTPNACYELIEDSVKVNGVAMTPVNGTLSFEAMETNYVIEAAFRGQILSVKTTCDTALGNVVVEDKEYRYGDEIVVKATAVENYRVYGAIVNGKTVATDGVFTIKSTDYVATNFDVEVLIKGVDVKVKKNAENGTIEVVGETIYNGEVTFNFVPANGYKFVSATVNGEVVTTSSYTTTLTSTVYEVTATYEIKEVTVSMNMYLDGVAMQEPLVKEYKWFDEVELTEMDFDKFPVFFKLVEFTINGKDASGMIGEDGLVRFTAENNNYDVKVYVTYQDITIKTNAENATVTFDKDAYKFGDEVTFTVTPNEGYNVIKVGVVERELTVDGNTYTFTATNYVNPLSYEILVATEIKESILTATMIIDGEKQTMSAPVEWFTEQELMFAAPSEELQLIVATINGESVIDKIDEEGYYSFIVKADAYDIVAEYVTKTSAVTATGDAHAVVTLNADAYKWGDKVTVSVAVATGYEIKSATVNGESFEFTDGEYTFKAWADKYEIVVTTISSNVAYSEEIIGNGTVTATGSFIYNEKVTFEFIADEGYEFASATVNGVEVTESTYVYTVDSLEIEVTATFVLKNAVVNPIVVFDGVEIVSPELPKVPWFKELNLSFYGENSGIPEQYEFEYATLNGVDITSEIVDGRYTFVVKADAYEIKAYYVTKSVSVNTIANNATVTFEKGAYKWGDTVNFEVTANEGYKVTEVTVNGEVVTDYTFTANGETFEIEVTTELKDVTIVMNAYLNGLPGEEPFVSKHKWFDEVTLDVDFSEKPVYLVIDSFTINGKDATDMIDKNGLVKFVAENETYDVKIYMSFAEINVTGSGANATVEFDKESYKWNDTVNFTVTANAGYNVTEVTVNGEVVTEYTFTASDINSLDYAVEVKTELKDVEVTGSGANATVTFEKDAYKWGDTVNFEVTANEGYEVTEVTVNGEVVTDYTFTANGEQFVVEVTTRTYYIESNQFIEIKDERATRSSWGSNGSVAYVDADAIAKDDTLPALPVGESAYLKYTGTGNAWGFYDIFTLPMSDFETFANAEFIEFQVYATGERKIYFFNNLIATVPANTWSTVKMPMAIYNQTQNTSVGSINGKGIDAWYSHLANKGIFVSIVNATKNAEELVYISSMKYTTDTPDTTLGYNYTTFDTENIYSNGTKEKTTFDGKEVIKITGGAWCNIFANVKKTYTELKSYDKVVVDLYIDGADAITFYSQALTTHHTNQEVVYYGSYQPNKWVQVQIPMSRVLQIYADYYKRGNALIIVQNKAFNAIYIAGIRVANDMTGVALETGVFREGEVTLNYTNTNNIEGITLSVKDANGQAVELTNNTFTATAGEYTVTFSADGYVSVTEQFTVYPEFNATIADPTVDGLTVTTGAITLTDPATGGALEGATVTVTAKYGEQDITVTDGKFIAPYRGATYKVIYTVSYNSKEYTYEKSVVIARPTAEAGEVNSFVAPCDIEKVVMGTNTINNITWLSEFEGESGVAKFEHKGEAWPWLGFASVQEMSAYADYDYIVFRMYISSTGGKLKYMVLGNYSEKDTTPIGYDGTVAYDQWIDYIFDIEVFKIGWSNDLNNINTGKYKLWFKADGVEQGTYYISDISAIKVASKANLTVKTEGELREGEVFSVSYNNPDNLTNVKMTVKDPAGNVVADPSAITGVFGTYTVEFTADGYYGVVIKEFSVAASANIEIGEHTYANDVLTVGDVTITLDGANVTDQATITKSAVAHGQALTIEDDGTINISGLGGGTYTVNYVVVYKDKTYNYSKSYTVERTPVAKDEIYIFSDIASLDDVNMSTSTSESYVTDAPVGATHGSVAFDISQVGGSDGNNWPNFYFAPRQAKSVYENYAMVAVTLKFVGADTTVNPYFFNNTENVHVPSNKWITILVKASNMVACYDQLVSGEYSCFWFTNIGANTIQKVLVHEIKVCDSDELFDVNEQTAITSNIYVNSGTTEYIDQADIDAANGALPALPAGATGYVKLTGTTNDYTVLELRFKPTGSKEAFISADYIEFDYYAGTSVDRDGNTVDYNNVYFHNALITTTTAGQWNTVRVPVSYYNHASGLGFASREAWYNALVNGTNFVNFWQLGRKVQASVYISDIRFVVDEWRGNIGDNYTELNTTNVTASSATVTESTFDGKNVLKFNKTADAWVNIFVKPGKTIAELKQYENLVFRMYIEQSNDANGVELYTQTGGLYFYGGTDGVADGNYFETGKWIDVVIPMSHVIANYDAYMGGAEIMIDRKDITAGTSFYISEIVCTPARYASVNVTAPVNGSVTADSYVKIGEQSTLTVTANTGYALANLTVDGVDVTAQVVDGKYTFTATTANVNVVATFAPVDVTVTATGENVTVTGAGSYKYGEEVTLTFTPSENYKIDSVKVNGTEVTLTDGKYTFTAGLTNEVVVTTSLSIIREDLTATPIDVNLGNGQATYVITHADIEGTITAVYNNGADVTSFIAIEGNKVTFAKEALLSLGYGEKTFEVYTATHIYTVKVVLITKVITTAEELLAIETFVPIKEWTWKVWEGSTTAYSYGGYFVLGNSIELGNTAVSFPITVEEGKSISRVWLEDESKHNPAGAEEYSEAGFHGTFDGRGYTINGGIYGVGGLFGNVWKTGVIKNVALENVTLIDAYRSAVIGISYFGTMDNVYIHVTENKHAVNTNEYAFLATNSGSTARMNNVFVYDETPKAVYPEDFDPAHTKFSSFINHMSGNPGAGAFTNVYVFTNNNVGYISSTQNHEVAYLDCGVVKKAVTDTLEGIDTSSFNAYWDFSGDRATFKSTKVAPVILNTETFAPVGTLVASASGILVKFEVEGEGVSVSGNIVTITDVAQGKTFTLKAVNSISGLYTSVQIYVPETLNYNVDKIEIDLSMEKDLVIDVTALSVDGEYDSLKIDGVNYDATYEGGKATVKNADVNKLMGEKNVTIAFKKMSADGTYVVKTTTVTVPVLFITKVITTGEELVNLLNYGINKENVVYNAGWGDDVNAVKYHGYFVLGNSIDLTGIVVKNGAVTSANLFAEARPFKNDDASSYSGFNGTFDGRGYTLYGGTYAQNGLFGNVAKGSVIKNVAIVNATVDGRFGAIMGVGFRGTLENVLIEVINIDNSDSSAACRGVVSSVENTTTYKNVIIYVNDTVAGNDGGFYSVSYSWNGEASTVGSNSYIFTNYNTTENTPHTAFTINSANATLAEAGVDASKFDSTIWDLTGDKAKFAKQLQIIEIPESQKVDVDVKNANFSVNVSALGLDKIDAIEVGGKKINSFTYEGGVITASTADIYGYVWGNVTAIIYAGNVIVRAPVLVYRSISTKEEFLNFIAATHYVSGNNVDGYTGYIVLTADIDFDNAAITAKMGQWQSAWVGGWNGTLDGRGHTISNYKINGQDNGLFKLLNKNGVVKNLIIYNVAVNGSSGAIACAAFGRIENVVVYGTLDNATNLSVNTGLFASNVGSGNTAVFKNCLAVLKSNGNPVERRAGMILGSKGNGNYENIIGVQLTGDVKVPVIADGAKNLSDYQANAKLHDTENIKTFSTINEYGAWVTGDGATATWANMHKSFMTAFIYDNIQPTAAVNALNAGDSVTVTCAQPTWVNWSISPAVEGVSVSPAGVVSVANTVSAGTTFAVVATGVDGTTRSMNFVVTKSIVDTIASVGEVDINGGDATFAINLGKYAGKNIVSVKFNDTVIPTDAWTVEGGNVVVTKQKIKSLYGEGTFTIVSETYSDSVLVEQISMSASATLITKIITTKEEFLAIEDYAANTKSVTWTQWAGETTDELWGGYFVLGNHIDLGTTVVSRITSFDGTPSRNWTSKKQEVGFAGTFDGRGYTIVNGIYGSGGLFGYVYDTAVIKNVALLNVNVNSDPRACVLGVSFYGALENVLIDVKSYTRVGGEESVLGMNTGENVSFKNVVLYDETVYTGMNGSQSSFFNHATSGGLMGTIENVFVFTNHTAGNGNGKTHAADWANAGVVTKKPTATLAEAGVDATKFDSTIWDLTGDKAAFVKVYVPAVKTEITIPETLNVDVKNATFTADLSAVKDVLGDTFTVEMDGVPLNEYTYEGGKITINTAILAGIWGNKNVMIESATAKVTATLLVYRSINNVDEFVNMYSYLTLTSGTAGAGGSTYDGYLVLTADIDAAGKNMGFGGWTDAGWCNKFTGTFDGQGHSIYNLTENDSNGGIFSATTDTAVFKNVRFYNASVGGNTGLIATNWDGLLENVFVSGKITGGGANWAVTSLLVTKGSAAKIKNCAAVLEDNKLTVNGSNHSGIVFGEAGSTVKFENVITVQLGGTKTTNYNLGRIPMGAENYLDNESNTVKAFDSAEAYVAWLAGEGATAEWATTVKGYISDYVGAKIQPTATSNVITAGNTVSVVCAQPSWVANWAISPAVAGVSISNAGVVTVANTVSAGTTFNVVTTGVDGTTRSMSFIVCEFVNLTAATQYIDLSNSETNTVINLTDKVEGEFVSAKVAGNTAVANASGAVVTIGADQFAFGNNTVVLRFEKKSGDVVIKVTEVTVTVKKADLVISDVESFNKINAIYTAKVGATVFVKNDFTYTGTYPNAAVTMNGYFYGDGHVITNLTVKNSIFGVTGTYGGDNYAVIRDIAFVNATVTVSGLALISDSAGGNFTNIYVSLSNKCATGVFAISKNSGGSKRMHDIFVDLTATPTAYVMKELHENLGPTLRGVYAIGGGSKINGQVGGSSKESPITDIGAAYADRNAMKTATNWQAEFATWDKNFWTTDSDGLPIAKSVKETIKLTTTTEVELNNAEKKTTSITVNGVENLGTVTYASIGGKNIDGVTAKNNVITVDATKVPATVWGNCELSVYTTDYYVVVPVLVITKMIRTAGDLDQMKALSKATSIYDSRAEGYFALANNISYNKTFACFYNGYAELDNCKDWVGGDSKTDARHHGFQGVLDGRGYAIDGLSVQYWSGGMFLIFGGTIKDIAFTNVTLPGNTGLFAYNHGGTIKNVYVQVKEVKANTDTSASYTILGSGGYGQVKVIDCFVDVPQNTVNNFFGIGKSHLGYGCVQGVYVVGNTNPIGAISTKENGTADIYNGYADRAAMAAATDWQAEFDTWDKNFWTTDADGLPIPVSVKNA